MHPKRNKDGVGPENPALLRANVVLQENDRRRCLRLHPVNLTAILVALTNLEKTGAAIVAFGNGKPATCYWALELPGVRSGFYQLIGLRVHSSPDAAWAVERWRVNTNHPRLDRPPRPAGSNAPQ